jgi:hypothetical protein
LKWSWNRIHSELVSTHSRGLLLCSFKLALI